MTHRHVLPVALFATTTLLGVAGCATSGVPPAMVESGEALVAASGGPNRSASYVLRVEGGVVVFDLGWWGATGELEEALADLDATPEDVIAVFLTHAHRDHLGAWRLVDHAPFHMTGAEAGVFFRDAEQGGWIPRFAERLKPTPVPQPGEVYVDFFADDTAFVFGTDTIHAFPVPGHTRGSAAYLVRGTLLAGDAIAWSTFGGIRPARAGYSSDTDLARRSLVYLRERLRPHRVEWLCSAHLKCVRSAVAAWDRLTTGVILPADTLTACPEDSEWPRFVLDHLLDTDFGRGHREAYGLPAARARALTAPADLAACRALTAYADRLAMYGGERRVSFYEAGD